MKIEILYRIPIHRGPDPPAASEESLTLDEMKEKMRLRRQHACSPCGQSPDPPEG